MYRRYFLLFAMFVASATPEKFKVIREWKFFNFTWPDREFYATAVSRGNYIPEHNIISGLDFYKNYYYLTLPRMKDGVPATLVRIPAGKTNSTSPALEPFPSWEMNKEGDCNALQNVQNIEIDPKGQLWIIDSGRTETLNTPSSRCPPKLIIFDIKKNMTTTAYTFPENVASLNSNYLYDIVIDDTDGGYAYITDNSARDPGIIVFSVKDHHSWKIRHSQTMRADPSAITFKVNGVIINSPLNLAAIALGPKVHASSDRIVVDEDREVFYSPISSLHFYSINTTVLRNEQNGMNNEEYQGNVRDCGIKQSQTSGIIMDNQGVLYYTLLGTNSIAKWNSHTPFESKHRIISKDERFLEWPSAFTFDQNGNITVLVNRLNKFIYDQLNMKEANFRLITSHIGANSYLFNQAYDYSIEPNATKQPTIENKAPQPEILPGSNDPYLVPQPIPARNTNTESSVLTNPVSQPREEPDPNSEFEMKMMLESEIKPEREPKSEPEPKAEPTSEPQPEPTTEPVAEPEPTAEPEPEPSNHAQHKHIDHNTSTAVPASSGTASNSNLFVIIFSAIVGVIIFVCGYLFGSYS